MSGSQQSSRCSAIWNVMKRSRYMWLWRRRRSHRQDEQTHTSMQRTKFTHKTRCTFQLEASLQPLTHQNHQLHQLSQTPVTLRHWSPPYPSAKQKKKTYTVLLSCLISLEENSLRMSKKARLRGGPPSPWGLGSLNANSIPSLGDAERERITNCEQR